MEIDRGAVFLHASWSGSSARVLPLLLQAWQRAKLPKAELLVLDWDEHEVSLRDVPELSGKVHGYGEGFLVRDGVITHFQVLGGSRVASVVELEVASFVEKASR